MRGLLWLLRHLSPESAAKIAGNLFNLLGPLTKKRQTIIKNLSIAFPEKSSKDIKKLSRRVFYYLGIVFAELVHTKKIGDEADKRLEFVVTKGTVIKRNHPYVFASAHVGGWQYSSFIAEHYNVPGSVIYAPESNPYLQPVFLALRNAAPVNMIPRDNIMRHLMRELSAKRCIGLTVDTRLDQGKPVPFFGKDALTNIAPAHLALRYQCDLIPIQVERLPHMRYRIHIGKPLKPNNPHADKEQQALDMTHQLNVLFEQWIKETPEQWMCLKRRWPKEKDHDNG